MRRLHEGSFTLLHANRVRKAANKGVHERLRGSSKSRFDDSDDVSSLNEGLLDDGDVLMSSAHNSPVLRSTSSAVRASSAGTGADVEDDLSLAQVAANLRSYNSGVEQKPIRTVAHSSKYIRTGRVGDGPRAGREAG